MMYIYYVYINMKRHFVEVLTIRKLDGFEITSYSNLMVVRRLFCIRFNRITHTICEIAHFVKRFRDDVVVGVVIIILNCSNVQYNFDIITWNRLVKPGARNDGCDVYCCPFHRLRELTATAIP